MSDNRILQPNEPPNNAGSDNRIYINSMQCVQNQTEQLVVNGVFNCAIKRLVRAECCYGYQAINHNDHKQ